MIRLSNSYNSYKGKMATMMKVSLLLMLPININLLSIQEPIHVIGTKDGFKLQMWCSTPVESIIFYRLDQDKPQFVRNYTSEQANFYMGNAYIWISNSESQDYEAECWKNGIIEDKKHFHVTVCTEKDEDEKVSLLHGAPADIACQKFNPSLGETLQVFQRSSTSLWITQRILDTSVSMEIIPDTLRNRMQVLNNGSLIHLTDTSSVDSGVYSCLIWSENKCQNLKEISLDVEKQDLFFVPGESFTVPCLVKGSKPEDVVVWWTPTTVVISGLKTEESDNFEILNGTQTGNYSLVIHHLMPHHTGTYTCSAGNKNFNKLNIFVCIDLKVINMTFSLGDRANLTCRPEMAQSFRVQWYWESKQSSKRLLADTQGGFVNEEMKGRLDVSDLQNYITIRELSMSDSGVYLCKVWGLGEVRKLCFNQRVKLTYVGPYVDTLYCVYASVVGLVLLGMISTVVYVSRVTRDRRTATGI